MANLQKLVTITFRSSTQLAGVEATARFDPAQDAVQIIADDATTSIMIADIEAIKAKDYMEDESYCWVLVIQLAEGRQASLQFRLKEQRDTWTSELKSLANAAAGKSPDESADKKEQFRNITEVELKEPGDGVLASAAVKLEKGGEVTVAQLSVPDSKFRPDDVKHLTQEFIDANQVNPAESTSLYRFLRTVVQRVRVEKETASMIDEIQSNSLESLLKKPPDDDEHANMTVAQLRSYAEARLKGLKDGVQRRLGDGTGANILSSMLMQNIDKTLSINELCAKFHQPPSEVTTH
mmetsp:Transcript_62329/g.182070  ORF Transcript_62329/g.182070 Transcript_62329/m.182070 type:complete len:294 (-) Transcript_62329:84-965(-)